MYAKKSLGQNFLKDNNVLKKIRNAISRKEVSPVCLEVGPGMGDLTGVLLEIYMKVIVLEIDANMIEKLEKRFPKELSAGRLEIRRGDVMEFDTTSIYSTYDMISNIPFYITGAILRKFLQSENRPRSMFVIIQKEVAERVTRKDNPKHTMLSLSADIYSKPKYLFTIKKNSFTPAPKVDAGFVEFSNINKNFFESRKIDEADFFNFARIVFGNKRKQLAKNLKEGVRIPKEKICDFLKGKGISEFARAEDLSKEVLADIYLFLRKEVGDTDIIKT